MALELEFESVFGVGAQIASATQIARERKAPDNLCPSCGSCRPPKRGSSQCVCGYDFSRKTFDGAQQRLREFVVVEACPTPHGGFSILLRSGMRWFRMSADQTGFVPDDDHTYAPGGSYEPSVKIFPRTVGDWIVFATGDHVPLGCAVVAVRKTLFEACKASLPFADTARGGDVLIAAAVERNVSRAHGAQATSAANLDQVDFAAAPRAPYAKPPSKPKKKRLWEACGHKRLPKQRKCATCAAKQVRLF
jgi:hypothetical protein